MNAALRLELDPLIGRDADIERVTKALARTRLVTITGPGGTGKTRLAAAIVEQLRRDGDEAWFIDLTTVPGPELVAAAVVSALGLRGASPEPGEIVTGALRDHAVLLALDNVEQIRDVGRVVGGWLTDLPELRLLLTSRIPVGAPGEIQVHLDTLELPARDDPAAVEAAPASALFLRRARSIGRLDSLDERTARDVAALVTRLEGLPLAVELAAARTRIMSAAEILGRLERDGTAAVDRPAATGKSLRSIFDWTYSLLEPDQRTTLAAVALCPSFDLELAEALVPGVDLARALDALVAVSLVRQVPSRTVTRFRVFESVRQEVVARTAASDRAMFLGRHAVAMLERLANLAAVIDARSPRWAFDRLEDEVDNGRQALETLEGTDPSAAVRMWRELRHFWWRPARVREGLARLARLEATGAVGEEDLCAAAFDAVLLTDAAGGFGAGLERLERGLRVARRVGDDLTEMALLVERARINGHLGNRSAAEADAARVAALAEANPSDRSAFLASDARMFAAVSRPVIDDQALADAQAAAARAVGGASMRTRLLREGNVAMCKVHRREHADAVAIMDRILARRADLGPDGLFLLDNDVVWFAHVRAEALAGLGRFEEATAQIIEGLDHCLPDPPLQDVVCMLSAAQLVAAGQGKFDLAARLFGWLDSGGRYDMPDREAALSIMRRARRELGETAVALAIRDGADADPVTMLKAIPELLAEPATPTGRRVRKRHAELTRREVEIAELVAQGKSNREIADILFISPKTASVHVANIREKLGAHTRLDVALRARTMGLSGK